MRVAPTCGMQQPGPGPENTKALKTQNGKKADFRPDVLKVGDWGCSGPAHPQLFHGQWEGTRERSVEFEKRLVLPCDPGGVFTPTFPHRLKEKRKQEKTQFKTRVHIVIVGVSVGVKMEYVTPF